MDAQASLRETARSQNTLASKHGRFTTRWDKDKADLLKIQAGYKLLDINHLNQHPQEYLKYYKQFKAYGTLREHAEHIFGAYKPRNSNNTDKNTKVMLQLLHESTRGARKTELIRKIQYQMQESHSKGHFIVFNTLTVNNHNYATVFQNGKAYTDYLRKITNAVTTPTERSMGIKNHHHFAVVEEGDKNGRLHIHSIHMLARLPHGCSDPNTYKLDPTEQEIYYFKHYWKWGNSCPIAVRFGPSDAYTLSGWRWPTKDGQPIQGRPPSQLANYVGKYVNKAQHTTPEAIKWRTKMSRGLGTTILKLVLYPMTQSQLLEIIQLPSTKPYKIMGKQIPKILLKRQAMKYWLDRALSGNKKIKYYNLILELTPQPSIVKQWTGLTHKRTRYSLPNTPSTPTENSMTTDTSKKLLQNITQTEKNINYSENAYNISGNTNRP